MLNLNNLTHSPSPYNWFMVDNLLDEVTYQEVKNEVKFIFDNIANIESSHYENAARYDKNFPRGLSSIIGGNTEFKIKISSAEMVLNETINDGALEKLCKNFLNKDVQINLYRLLVPFSTFDFKSIRPIKVHQEFDEMTILDYLFFKNCFVNLKLSSYTSNFGLYQHKDHGNKVTALLLYFGFTDDIQHSGSALKLYKVSAANKRWSKKESPSTLDYYDDKKLNLVKEIHCAPNRLVGFRKTRNSWHGVDPSKFPLDVRRQALQINLMKHYNSSKSLRKFSLIISKIKGLLRPIVKALLGYK